MTQAQLNRAVAQATGESVETIRRYGFSIVQPLQVFDPDHDEPALPQLADWDQIELDRGRRAA
jgi:hypothetical protein